MDDYADLGYGYDSNDSFIDNGDVHDEIVPENVTTAYGGFYVNSGPLEFKARESADEDSDLEAVIQEGEKATKKRKYVKKNGEKQQPPKKKIKTPDQSPAASPAEGTEIKKPRFSKVGIVTQINPFSAHPSSTSRFLFFRTGSRWGGLK